VRRAGWPAPWSQAVPIQGNDARTPRTHAM
jgi:hypothetical protein